MRISSRTRRAGPILAGALTVTVVAATLAVRLASHSPIVKPSGTAHAGLPAPTGPSSTSGSKQMGRMTEFPIPPDLVYLGHMSSGPDNSLWALGGDAHDHSFIVRVTTSGTFDEHAIPDAFARELNINAITEGPDGNVWFTETGAVVKMTASGAFTRYTIGPSHSEPFGIATGLDGNLWVTDQAANKVLKMTTSGVVTAYAIPTPDSEPGPITAGLDGNLWFTEAWGGKVGRISTSGAVTEFPLSPNWVTPRERWLPIDITAGPDGNVWIIAATWCCAGAGPGEVVNITPWGGFTTYPIPGAKLVEGEELMREPSPRQITLGPDGNVWFSAVNNLDSVTESGDFSQYVVSTVGGVVDVESFATGTDGMIWFSANCFCHPQRLMVGTFVIPSES